MPTGPITPYRPKDLPNVVLQMPAREQRAMRAAARRSRQTASTIVEHLLRKHAGELRADDVGAGAPYIRPNPCVSLTALAKQLLQAAAERTGKSRGRIVAELVRRHAAAITREEFEAIENVA